MFGSLWLLTIAIFEMFMKSASESEGRKQKAKANRFKAIRRFKRRANSGTTSPATQLSGTEGLLCFLFDYG